MVHWRSCVMCLCALDKRYKHHWCVFPLVDLAFLILSDYHEVLAVPSSTHLQGTQTMQLVIALAAGSSNLSAARQCRVALRQYRVAHWDDHAAPGFELIYERRRHLRCCSSHMDCVIRSPLWAAPVPICLHTQVPACSPAACAPYGRSHAQACLCIRSAGCAE